MRKNTQELLEVLKRSPSLKNFLIENEEDFADITLSEFINSFLSQKQLNKSEVIQSSNLTQVYGYKILSGERIPQRDKVLCLAFGLKLNLDETQRMLKIAAAGALYPKVRRDSIIMFAIKEHTDLFTCNEMLYDLGEDILD